MKVNLSPHVGTTVTIQITERQALAVLDALAYWDSCEGGNNFEMGYKGAEGKEEGRKARSVRTLIRKMGKRLDVAV